MRRGENAENVSLSATWKKMEVRDDRIFEFDSSIGHTYATISDITNANGMGYDEDTNTWADQTYNRLPKSYVIYVQPPAQYQSREKYKLYFPTWRANGTQDDLIWYGYKNSPLPAKTTGSGCVVTSERDGIYECYTGAGGNVRAGQTFGGSAFIYGYDDTVHTNQFGTNNTTYAWNWVYPTNGYYDSKKIVTDIYLIDAETGEGVKVDRKDGLSIIAELEYQLRGHVFYNNNDGSGTKTDRIMDINMDIIRTDIPTLTRTNPARAGYTMLGWGISSDADIIYTSWNWRPQKDLNLYAQWMQNAITL